ncbi:MAG: GNAT family N-acetyltransferase [Aggregatilineales bacterium]
MSISYRALNPDTDYPRLAEIITAYQGEPVMTADMLREQDAHRPPGEVRWQALAADARDRIIGIASAMQPVSRPTGHFQMSVLVDAPYRQQGIGAALYTNALQFARERGAIRLFGNVRDDQPDARRFAEQRGYTIDRHIFGSILDVTSFDETLFAGTIKAVEATGVRFTDLAEVGDTPEHRRKLYELLRLTDADAPGRDNHPDIPFERFQNDLYDAPGALADGTILAVDGDQWIGFTALGRVQDDTFQHYITGVDRRYRGRKVALAVKLLAVRWAKRHGIARLYVNNDAANTPMLAINVKMGYRRLPGWYTFIRQLV